MSLSETYVAPNGADKPIYYFIGEAPGATEEQYGKPFIGAAGQTLRKFIKMAGIAEEECRFHNVVPYRPENNRTPTKAEIHEHTPQLLEDIKATRPTVLIPCGDVPLAALLPTLRRVPKITGWRGRVAPYYIEDKAFWMAPIWHPSYVNRIIHDRSMGREYGRTYQNDLVRIMGCNKPTFPAPYDLEAAEDSIDMYFSEDEIIFKMNEYFKDEQILSFDVETTGINPYGADITMPLTVSLTGRKRTMAFPISHPEIDFTPDQQQAIFTALTETLRDKYVVGQNVVFDIKWLLINCVTDEQFNNLASAKWQDTMVQAHFIDERSGMLSLDTLCFLHFGIPIKSESGVDVTRLMYEPLRKVLRYNALDTILTFDLFKAQHDVLKNRGQVEGYLSHNERLFPLATMMDKGIPVHGEEVIQQIKDLTKKEKELLETIQADEAVLKLAPDLNPNSPKQLLKFFKELGFAMRNEKGKETTDEPMMNSIDHPVASAILGLRGVRKSMTTLKQYLSGEDRGFYAIHANFLHTSTTTGRTSCRDPNLQNLNSSGPMRRIIAAPEGYVFIDVDYKQLEACIIASCSKDDFFLHALDNDLDVHRRWALWFAERYPSLIGGKKNLSNEAVINKFRKVVKNSWTFPAFYNAQLYALQRYMGIPEKLATEAYNLFWKEFAGVREWQQELISNYNQFGYVESPTYRRRYAPLKPTEIVNSPIQGAASDIVIKAMEKLVKVGWIPVANIHDELLFCEPKIYAHDLLDSIKEHMLSQLFDWLITPLSINVKAGTHWDKASLQDIGEFKGSWK